MNRNLKQSIWVLAIGVAFTAFGSSSVTAAAPIPQGQPQYQDRNQDQDQNSNRHRMRWFFQQGLQDGQFDRQNGGNRTDHQQPQSGNAQLAYLDGYKHGFRNIPTNEPAEQSRTMDYFDQGLRDGEQDRLNGGNRTDHQQPQSGDAQLAYLDGYKHGFRNIPTNEQDEQSRTMDYFDQGLQDGQYDRQNGGNRTDHQQPQSGYAQLAYIDGYKHGFQNIPTNQRNEQSRAMDYFDQGLRDGQFDRQNGGNRTDHQQPQSGNAQLAYIDGYKHGFQNIPTNQRTEQSRATDYFNQGLRDGQFDRRNRGNRTDHRQPNDPNDLRAYLHGYKQGYRNTGGRSN